MAGRNNSSERRERRRDTSATEGATGRKRSRYLEGRKVINPGDYELLEKFVTEHGKIMPARITGTNAKQQRVLKKAIRRARVMGVLP